MGIELPPLHHTAIAVKDLDASKQFYSENFGIRWLPEQEASIPKSVYRGKPNPFKIRKLEADMEGARLQLVQTLEGETTDLEFLRTRGEGVSHFGYHVSNLQNILDELAKHGIKPVWYADIPEMGFKFAFVEMQGTFAEFLQLPEID